MSLPKVQLQMKPRLRDDFVCGGEAKFLDLPQTETIHDVRRETYVHERPAPRGGDVVESTPIRSSRTETFRDIRRETIVTSRENKLDFETVGLMLPPTQTDIRRQTYIPEKKQVVLSVKPVIPVVAAAVSSLEKPLVQLSSIMDSYHGGENSYMEELQVSTDDLSLSPRKSVSVSVSAQRPLEPVLTDVLARLMNTSICEPLNLSVKADTTTDCEEQTETRTVVSPLQSRMYLPRVSDVSLPSPRPELPLLPMKDPRLLQLLEEEDVGGGGALDLSTGSQLGDCSMAVHLATPARQREEELEQELVDIEDRSSGWDEAELDRIAQARGTSASGVAPETGLSLSAGTVVLQSASPALLEVELEQWKLLREEEVFTTEVTEEEVEYEYEIVDGLRRLLSERTVGSSVRSHTETVTRTPVKSVQCKVRREVEVVTEEQDNQPHFVDIQLDAVNPKVRISTEFCIAFSILIEFS